MKSTCHIANLGIADVAHGHQCCFAQQRPLVLARASQVASAPAFHYNANPSLGPYLDDPYDGIPGYASSGRAATRPKHVMVASDILDARQLIEGLRRLLEAEAPTEQHQRAPPAPPHNHHTDAQLTNAIKNCRSVEQLATLVGEHEHSLNALHLSAVASQLSSLMASPSSPNNATCLAATTFTPTSVPAPGAPLPLDEQQVPPYQRRRARRLQQQRDAVVGAGSGVSSAEGGALPNVTTQRALPQLLQRLEELVLERLDVSPPAAGVTDSRRRSSSRGRSEGSGVLANPGFRASSSSPWQARSGAPAATSPTTDNRLPIPLSSQPASAHLPKGVLSPPQTAPHAQQRRERSAAPGTRSSTRHTTSLLPGKLGPRQLSTAVHGLAKAGHRPSREWMSQVLEASQVLLQRHTLSMQQGGPEKWSRTLSMQQGARGAEKWREAGSSSSSSNSSVGVKEQSSGAQRSNSTLSSSSKALLDQLAARRAHKGTRSPFQSQTTAPASAQTVNSSRSRSSTAQARETLSSGSSSWSSWSNSGSDVDGANSNIWGGRPLPAMGTRKSKFTGQELAMLAWGLARMQQREQEEIKAARRRRLQRLGAVTAHNSQQQLLLLLQETPLQQQHHSHHRYQQQEEGAQPQSLSQRAQVGALQQQHSQRVSSSQRDLILRRPVWPKSVQQAPPSFSSEGQPVPHAQPEPSSVQQAPHIAHADPTAREVWAGPAAPAAPAHPHPQPRIGIGNMGSINSSSGGGGGSSSGSSSNDRRVSYGGGMASSALYGHTASAGSVPAHIPGWLAYHPELLGEGAGAHFDGPAIGQPLSARIEGVQQGNSAEAGTGGLLGGSYLPLPSPEWGQAFCAAVLTIATPEHHHHYDHLSHNAGSIEGLSSSRKDSGHERSTYDSSSDSWDSSNSYALPHHLPPSTNSSSGGCGGGGGDGGCDSTASTSRTQGSSDIGAASPGWTQGSSDIGGKCCVDGAHSSVTNNSGNCRVNASSNTGQGYMASSPSAVSGSLASPSLAPAPLPDASPSPPSGCSSQDVSLISWAMAVLRVHPSPPFMAQWLQVCSSQMSIMSGVDVAQLAWALAKLQYRPPVAWMQAMAGRAAQLAKQKQLKPRDTANLLWALANLRFDPGAAALDTLLSTLPSEPHTAAAAYKPMDAANVLWALGVLQRKPAPVAMQMLLAAVCDGPSPLSQQELSNILWGLARLNYAPSLPTQRALVAQLHRLLSISIMGPSALAQLAWALPRLRLLTLPHPMQQRLAAAMLAAAPRMNTQGLLLSLEWVHRCGVQLLPSQVDFLTSRVLAKLLEGLKRVRMTARLTSRRAGLHQQEQQQQQWQQSAASPPTLPHSSARHDAHHADVGYVQVSASPSAQYSTAQPPQHCPTPEVQPLEASELQPQNVPHANLRHASTEDHRQPAPSHPHWYMHSSLGGVSIPQPTLTLPPLPLAPEGQRQWQQRHIDPSQQQQEQQQQQQQQQEQEQQLMSTSSSGHVNGVDGVDSAGLQVWPADPKTHVLAQLLWVTVKLGRPLPREQLDNLLHASITVLPHLQPREVCAISWALVQTKHRPSTKWMRCLLERVRELQRAGVLLPKQQALLFKCLHFLWAWNKSKGPTSLKRT